MFINFFNYILVHERVFAFLGRYHIQYFSFKLRALCKITSKAIYTYEVK